MTNLSIPLSSPEAEAPKPIDAALKARQQKLRKIVVWVVGSAALLTCAAFVRAATRGHSESSTEASAPMVQAVAVAPTATPLPSATPEAITPAPAAAPVAASPVATSVPKAGVARVSKAPSKTAKRSSPVKSPTIARHF